MRGRVLVAFVIALAALPVLAGGGAAGTYTVRRALTPAQSAEAAKRGTRWTGPVLSPEQARLHALREQRDRRMPHRLAPTGFDWASQANRRRGYQARPARNPHLPVPAGARPAVLAAEPDTIRVALIRIDFLTDREGSRTTGNGRFDLSPPDTLQPPIDRPPRNRAFYEAHLEAQRRYFEAQSYGRVQVTGDVWPREPNGAYHIGDMADYGPWRFSQDIYGQAVRLMRDSFFAADSQSTAAGERIPWDSYDRFLLVHAGSDFQSDLRGDSEFDIPSFTLGVDDTNLVIFPDSLNRPIDRALIIPETVNQDGFYAALNGVIVHEQGHNVFGFADLYDINSGYPVVGYWSLMDSGNLVGSLVQTPRGETIYAVGLLPPSIDPFQRYFTTDALEFRDVSFGDTIRLAHTERNPDVRRLWLSSDEYVLIENRAILAGDTLELDQDTTTRVVLGPKSPDRFEYDALLPGAGVLTWHIDASVIPFSTALRQNPDYGWNSNPARLGISIIEADKLDDLGDLGSPFLLGSPLDPWFVGNATTLSDTTIPPLRPHIRTRPHSRLDVHDRPLPTMRIRATRTWQLPGWPVSTDFAAEGPVPLVVDADGDGQLDVCWAGGEGGSPDSASLFAVRPNGQGLFDPVTHVFATLDATPLQPLAALPGTGGSLFAVTTRITGATPEPGGKVWLLDHAGSPLPGWPATLPATATTPPVVADGLGRVLVGAADGRVYGVDYAGNVVWSSPALGDTVTGRLAVWGEGGRFVAYGSANGRIAVTPGITGFPAPFWERAVDGEGFAPEFLWLSFDGGGAPAGASAVCGAAGTPALIVHHENRLWAFCAAGNPLPGWGRAFPDTFLTGLAAADIDRDGYVEVLAQTRRSGVVYFNQSGAPPPGWPEPTTREGLPAGSPVVALDVDADGRPEMVSFDGSGKLNAMRPDGKQPEGWPLALGAGAVGAPVGGDLDGAGALEIVAPDRALPDSDPALQDTLAFVINGRLESLYGYSVPGSAGPLASPWPMVGGDPGRSAALPLARTPVAGASAAGGPYVAGTLKAYPNPARRRPVAFAFQLTEPAQVEVDIVDTSGHRVAAFAVEGLRAENVAVWEPGRAPAGLYLARLKFRGASGEHSEVIQVGVLK